MCCLRVDVDILIPDHQTDGIPAPSLRCSSITKTLVSGDLMFQRSIQASSKSSLRHLFYTRTTADHFIFILDQHILSIYFLVRDLGRCQRECEASASHCRRSTPREEVPASGHLGKRRANPGHLLSQRLSRIYSSAYHPRQLHQVAGLDGEFGGTGLDIRWGSNKLQQSSSRKDVTGTRREEAGVRAYSGG